MKIKKAIEIIQDIIAFVEPGDPPEEHDALKLSIAALARCQALAQNNPLWATVPLPGETPEEEAD
uniref:Uncharacterized protein n=1 Tax=viral metagenome TaxID=1070528 RepID=A0A6M3LV09_9ZZZZ